VSRSIEQKPGFLAKEETMPNHLANETSPYLLQHADNPVDWYPWGPEALHKAAAEDKPIFLSIGYSACHWCHVMAHESFEDERVAAILNEHYVSIKVDREERPDLDRIYMSAVQAMTGGGGWPMSVFISPGGTPFYGGTYFPPTPRHSLPAFSQLLLAIVNAWQTKRQDLLDGGERVVSAIEQQSGMGAAGQGTQLDSETLDSAVRTLKGRYDGTHGGWGSAPKFPQPMVIEFLLRTHHRTGDEAALDMVTHTLDAMARGGMYDQIGGGFHRYSTDARWLVPHFEKMLYDNAQLARVYLHAWQVTGNAFYRTIVEETLDYVVHEMTDPAGGFYSTQDADSEGEEGKFFVWTPDEIRDVLSDQADPFIAAYGVTKGGNFEGKNILEFVSDLDQRPTLAGARRKLFAAREQRVHPGRDDKVLTSWNGLMLAAFAEAARVLDRDDYRKVAERNATFSLHELKTDEGRLLRTWKACPEEHPEPVEGQRRNTGEAKLNGYLEDYSYLIEGLLELYQTTFDPRWYEAAHELAETMIAHFRAPDGGFYDTSDDHETLITRPRELQDNATPSGNAMATTVLLKLAGLAVEPRYGELARKSLVQLQGTVAQYPLGFGQWLQALSYALSSPREVALVGEPSAADTRALLSVLRKGYRPHQVVALGDSDGKTPVVPILRHRTPVDGLATAYVCVKMVCQPPVTDPAGLAALVAR
jgi:uncharacterized protein YyaL (SSP411 family)